MKNVNKIIFAFLFTGIFLFSGITHSQDNSYNGSAKERASFISDYLKEELNLTDEQYNEVYTTYLDHEKQRDKDFEDYTDDRDAFRDASDKRRAQLSSDMEKILDADQMEKYNSIRNEIRDKVREKFGYRGKNKPGRENR